MFLTQMAGYDLLKRSTTALEGHSASNFYYIEPFLLYGIPWTWLFLFFFFRGVKITRDKKKKFTGIAFSSYFSGALSWAWIAVPLAVVLLVTTKTSWYLDPVYPAIAVFTAWHLARFFSGLKNRRPADYLLPVFAGIVVVTEAVILAFNFTPVLSLSLNKGGDYAVLEKEILFQKLVLSIPTDMSGKNTIRIIPDGWTQSRLFCAMSMKGLVPIVSTNAAVYTIVMNGVSATNTPGERMSSNQSWSLYCIR
jgi:hypothetical protein